MTELIIKGKIKEAVEGLSVAGDVARELNKKVIKILEEAAERTRANNRRTLQGKDL